MKNTLTYPSYSGWITARTDDIQLTTDNMLLILPKPIAKLQKVLLNASNSASVFITYQNPLGEGESATVGLDELQLKVGSTYVNLTSLDITD